MRKFLLATSFCFSAFAMNAQTDSLKKEEVYTIVEEMPSFPGGQTEMMKFIQRNIRFPYYEKTHNISGTVYVTFVVDSVGNISKMRVLRGVARGPEMENEALQVVRKMPKWNPGKQNGRAVNVQFNLPVKFTVGNMPGMKEDLRPDAGIALIRTAIQTFNDAQDNNDKAKFKIAYDKFSEAIKFDPEEDLFLYRALCSFEIGNKKMGCSDVNTLYKMGDSPDANPLSEKYCK